MSLDEDRYGIGSAVQFFGGDDYPQPTTPNLAYYGSGDQPDDYPQPTTPDLGYYGGGDQEGDYPMPTNPQTPGAFGGDLTKFLNAIKGVGSTIKGIGGKALDFAQTPQGIMALLAALAAKQDRPRPSGGGTAMAYAGPQQMQRRVVQGRYGPIVQYAANGGIMHAYANGGSVRPFPMQDGGFVMTKRAVDGAGGPRGIAQLVPGARMIRGPGNGTSDSIPATIQGPRGQTPAKVSNGEAYVDPKDVKRQGGAPAMYALMRAMERKA